jgi:hypothetical protein
MQSVGFKEWALVCEALGRGEQSILLRKGGLAEGRQGFGFRHAEFFLFPTFFHEQTVKVRTPDAQLPTGREGEIEIRYFAKLEARAEITSWPAAAALERFHILEESVVRERFEYQGAGLARGAGSRVPPGTGLEIRGQTRFWRLQVVGGITGLPGRNAIRARAWR